ncbi:reverse transcriptase family protein [Idiomarina sp.]|uniref:reverse transcriptase family protein n=1 Tax=Idiomarina sp. TaxID=1874361 RepID=UPI003A8E721C
MKISTYKPINVIGNPANLAAALDSSLEELGSLIENKAKLYQKRIIPKKNGKSRTVYSVDRELKKIQNKINNRIFSEVEFASYLFGSISDPDLPRDYLLCAESHCPSAIIATIDIKDFFDHITDEKVEKIFSGFFNFPDDVAELLTELCTFQGRVPQGAPTSSYLANLMFGTQEKRIAKAANECGARYSRLLDDIIISSPQKNFSIDTLYQRVEQMIVNSGFQINETKSKVDILGPKPLEVHGIVVTGNSPKVSKLKYQEIRRLVHQVSDLSKTDNRRTTHRYYKKYHRAYGLLSILKRVNHPAHKKLKSKLTSAPPLPSNRFRNSIFRRLSKLESKHQIHQQRKWFAKDWNRISHELGILRRSYPEDATNARNRLNLITPYV